MITAPTHDRGREALRTIAEALAQALPITAGLAHLYQFTHPSQFEKLVEEWREQVSSKLNDHDAAIAQLMTRISPRMEIGADALALAIWLTENSPDGMTSPVSFDAIRAAFPELAKGVLEEACFELQHYGLIECEGAIGRAILDVRPRFGLFWTFDPMVMKSDPQKDAATLAAAMLEQDRLAAMREMEVQMAWPRRRLNPAIARLIPLFAPGHVSRERQNIYPTTHFTVTAEDRFRLKQFVREASR